MCTYRERHFCSYLAYDIILLPGRAREREREREKGKETEMVSGHVPMQTDCAVYKYGAL